MTISERLADMGCLPEEIEGAVIIDGMDKAIIGYSFDPEGRICLVYDHEEIVRIFMERDSMTHEEAEEWIDFNFYFPKKQSPVIIHRLNTGE